MMDSQDNEHTIQALEAKIKQNENHLFMVKDDAKTRITKLRETVTSMLLIDFVIGTPAFISVAI